MDFGGGDNMSKHLLALLVHDHPEPFESLKQTLKDLSVETYSVESCKDAEDFIAQCKPQVIFTQCALPDGSWVSILNQSEAANVPLDVIVVGMVFVLIALGFSLFSVKYRKQYHRHKAIQLCLAGGLLFLLVCFEIDIQFFEDWRERADASPYFDAATGVLSFPVSTTV